VNILGVHIDNLSCVEILDRVDRFLDEPKFHQIATVNPEFLVEADRNPEFKEVLNACDLRVADGFGITLASLFQREKLKCRFPGVDLMMEILRMADEKSLSVYLAVRADGLSTFVEIRSILLKRYPQLKVSGSDVKIADCRLQIAEFQSSIKNLKSAIILCNFGAPHQEFFLAGLKAQNIETRLALGVGGSFDYLTGKQRRAPKCLRTSGLEWLWRLMAQPKRIKRIWNAVIVFPVRMLIK